MSKSNFILKNLILSISSVFLFLLIIEIILRLIGFTAENKQKKYPNQLFRMGYLLKEVDPTVFGHYDKDRYLFWKLQLNSSEEVNSKRYRGVKRDYKKPAGIYRIILIGDSCAYGLMVRNSDTYAYLLEKKLNNDSFRQRFEVLNMGVPGYSSLQGVRYLKGEVIKYHPDMVLVGFGFNDLCDAVNKTDKEIETSPDWMIFLDNYLSKTRFYVFLKNVLYAFKERLIGKSFRSFNNVDNNRYSDLEDIDDLPTLIQAQGRQEAPPLRSALPRVLPGDYAENIKEMIKVSNEYKFKLVLLTLPSINGCFGYGKMLKLLSREYHVGIIDLIGEFKMKVANNQEYFVDNNHYNEKGHMLVADIIESYIKNLKLIGFLSK